MEPLSDSYIHKINLVLFEKFRDSLFHKQDIALVDTFFVNTVKFGFSEKATKFEKIFVVLLTRALCSVHATASVLVKKSTKIFFLKCGQVVFYKLYKGLYNQHSLKFHKFGHIGLNFKKPRYLNNPAAQSDYSEQ